VRPATFRIDNRRTEIDDLGAAIAGTSGPDDLPGIGWK
jgi:hypothetical protein